MTTRRHFTRRSVDAFAFFCSPYGRRYSRVLDALRSTSNLNCQNQGATKTRVRNEEVHWFYVPRGIPETRQRGSRIRWLGVLPRFADFIVLVRGNCAGIAASHACEWMQRTPGQVRK
jgi:hypothetical protein